MLKKKTESVVIFLFTYLIWHEFVRKNNITFYVPTRGKIEKIKKSNSDIRF